MGIIDIDDIGNGLKVSGITNSTVTIEEELRGTGCLRRSPVTIGGSAGLTSLRSGGLTILNIIGSNGKGIELAADVNNSVVGVFGRRIIRHMKTLRNQVFTNLIAFDSGQRS